MISREVTQTKSLAQTRNNIEPKEISQGHGENRVAGKLQLNNHSGNGKLCFYMINFWILRVNLSTLHLALPETLQEKGPMLS